jgi:uncharacterized coiled-coil protein SlyX
VGFINNALAKNSAKEILETLGKKLPKKLRKKIRWKKITPLLTVIISVLATLVRGRHASPAPSVERVRAAVPSERRTPTSRLFSDPVLQAQVERAEAYRVEIDHLARTSGERRIQEVAQHVAAWTTSITNLARRIEGFRHNSLIGKELKEVPDAIASLEARLARQSDPAMIAELERTIANRRQQLAMLNGLQQSIQMAEIKLESTLSMLGIIYSQILAGQSTRQIANYRRLLTEIDEEVHVLQDHLEALAEVKLTQPGHSFAPNIRK